jgi:alcohol dehydrogenase YqhD (iron-dependent ADH family)
MDFGFFMPAQLVFGRGKAKEVGSYVKPLGDMEDAVIKGFNSL